MILTDLLKTIPAHTCQPSSHSALGESYYLLAQINAFLVVLIHIAVHLLVHLK
jgi:hypothetical protein